MKFNSTELRGFLTGLIIGDGYIDKGISKRAFRIKSINKEFIDLINNELINNTQFKIKINYYESQIRNNVFHKEYWELYIAAHPYFRKLYSSFYDDYRHRRITHNVCNWLTPYGIACWFMSDGYMCLVGKTKNKIKDRRLQICTDAYSKEQVEMLCNTLCNKFNIKSTITNRKNSYRINIKTESYQTFFDLVYPYMVDSMKYKLYFGYEKQPIWMSDYMWEQQQVIYSAINPTSNVEGNDIV